MKNTVQCLNLLITALLLLTACEKMDFDASGEEPVAEKDEVQVRFNVTRFKQIPFEDAYVPTKASTEVSKICSRISLAVFQGATKVKLINQEAGDTGFGSFQLVLPKGDYTVVIIAHSGDGSAMITSPEEIKFPSNKVTDTFYQCMDLTVADNHSYDVQMKRAVGMFQLFIEDDMPAGVEAMQFKYTGGSSTLNARTGYGCVNSRQTETRDVTEAMTGKPTQFEIYSFPHEEDDLLKITVAVLGAGETEVYSRIFENVLLKRNVITKYTGHFFDTNVGGGSDVGQSSTFTLYAETDWTEVTHSY